MNRSPEFLDLLENNRGILLKVAKIYCANSCDQEELIQEMVFQIWKSFGSYRGESKVSTWMYRVALNTAITFVKKDKKQPKTNLDPTFTESMAFCETVSADQSQLDLFYQAVKKLSGIEKALILLFIDGFSHKEIAEQLGISEVNARVKLNRTKNSIKASLKEIEDEF